MFQSAQAKFVASPRMRSFLLGARWLFLLSGLALANFNTPSKSMPNPLPAFLGEGAFVLNFILVIYHIGASFYSLRCTDSRFNIYLLVLADGFAGCFLSYYYGISYFFLACLLPALEAALFLGIYASMLILIAIGAYYVPLIGIQWIKVQGLAEKAWSTITDTAQLRVLKDAAETYALSKYLTIFLIVSLVLMWVFSSALGQEEENFNLHNKFVEEKNILFEDLQATKREIGQLFNELEKRQQNIETLEQEISKTREELESVYKRLHEARLQTQAAQQLGQQKETQISQALRKEIEEVHRQMEEVNVRLTSTNSLFVTCLDLFKNLNPEETYLAIANNLLKHLPSQTCIIFVLEQMEGSPELFAEVTASPYSDYFRNFSLKPGEGAPGWVVEKHKPLKIDDGSVVIDGEEIPTLLTYEKSALAAPILYEEEALGALYLGRASPYTFTAGDMELLVSFAQPVAIALQNALLFQKTVVGGMYDEVTGVYNALYFNERFSEEIKRSHRYFHSLSLFLLDVDNFDRITKELGHEWGDATLKEVTDLIKAHVRETDIVARIQNNQFAVLLLQSDRSNAVLIAERIRMAMEFRSFSRPSKSGARASLSIGVANFPQDAKSKDDLIAQAEGALAAAKEKGGNNTCFPPG